MKGLTGALAGALIFWGAQARADEARDEALRHAQAGQSALEAQDFVRALAEFNEAYSLFPNPLLLVNVARAESGLLRNADAIGTLRRVQEANDLDPERRREVDSEIRRLTGLVGELRILVNEEGAEVTINGRAVGASPLRDGVVVDPGSVVVEARRAGGAPARWQGSVRAGDSISVVLAFERAPSGEAHSAAPSRPRSHPAEPSPPPRAARSFPWVWVTGVTAAVLGAGALTLGGVMLASCDVGEECGRPELAPVPYVADVLAIGALVSGGVFVYLLLSGEEPERAAQTVLAAPGRVQF